MKKELFLLFSQLLESTEKNPYKFFTSFPLQIFNGFVL